MKSVVASFGVDRTQYVNSEGSLAPVHPAFADDPDELVAMYEAMVLTRTFDAKAVALQRTGRLGTFASSLGQEAVSVGIGAAMHPDDVLVPSFREQGAQLWRGTTATELLLYWGGDERGSDFAGPRDDFPICVPIGTHAPHATGVALAFQLRHEPRAAVCVFGDGATSRGDVYESMNFAGVRRLPVVYVVNDNQWAISVPRAGQSGANTLAQKAIACGFEGEQVDGNDVIAVRDVVESAIARAREGWGPTLIEALTYRLADHTTVARLRNLLVHLDVWSRDHEEELIARCETTIDRAVEAYEATPPMPPSAMFEHLHANLPRSYRRQLDEVLRREGRDG